MNEIQSASKKGCLVKLDFWGLSKRPYTQQYKSIIFYPKLWYPEAWFPVVYSISLLSCMVKYKDASKDKSNLMPLNTLYMANSHEDKQILTSSLDPINIME